MASAKKTLPKLPLLKKWRFVEGKKGAGLAKYWWSDGSKSEEQVSSHMDAVDRLKTIQDGGGGRPAQAPPETINFEPESTDQSAMAENLAR